MTPEGDPTAELKVLVDTVVPRLDLFAAAGAAGEVVVRWKALDPHLAAETFKLEYQSAANEPWLPMAIEAPAAVNKLTLLGESTWWPKLPAGAVTIRAAVNDRAGNLATNQVLVQISGKAAERPDSVAAVEAENTTHAAVAVNTGVGPAPTNDETVASQPGPRGISWPADRTSRDPLPEKATPVETEAARPWRGVRERPSMDLPQDMAPEGSNVKATRNVAAAPVSARRELAPDRGAADERYNEPPSATDIAASAPAETTQASAARPRMVNTRGFEIEYEIENVGPSGIAKVEVWGTADGGKTWSVYGVDSDNRSPIVARVDREGVYGFTIVLHGGNGFSSWPPKAGDEPEFWVGVDLTKPAAKITAVEPGERNDEVTIRWEGRDDHPDPHPVSVFWSERPGAGWTALATNLENTGSYAWRFGPNPPKQVYLKLEFRDEAGNLEVFETQESVSLDRTRPTGRIRGVRPVNSQARRPSRLS